MTKSEWIKENKSYYNWYYLNYPFLKVFDLPLDKDFLQVFYKNDMQKRNLVPNRIILNNYDFLFSYFLANYPIRNDNDRFTGTTFLENLKEGIDKTFSGVSDFGGNITELFSNVNKYFPILLGLIAVSFYVKLK